MEEQVELLFPTVWHQKGTRSKQQLKTDSDKPKELRRKQYAAVQRLLNTSRKDAATTVLNGSWREPSQTPSRGLPGLTDFWAEIIGAEGPQARVPSSTPDNAHWALLDPISVEELRGSLRTLTTKAVGLDRTAATDLLSWHLPSLASVLNLILLTENLPAPLARSRITMIPKIPTPAENSDFRPLAISPILTRALHKIIARRMRDQL